MDPAALLQCVLEEFERAIDEARIHQARATTPIQRFTRKFVLDGLIYERDRIREGSDEDYIENWLLEEWQELGSPLGSTPCPQPIEDQKA